VADVVTVILSIVGGSLGGSALGAWLAARAQRTTRRGRARFVHEDLYRLQSTVTRLYHQTNAEREWGEKGWLLHPLAEREDQLDVVGHLRGWRFTACASALGWSDFIRRGFAHGTAPDDDALEKIYLQLAAGRLAVAQLARLPYAAHIPEGVVAPDRRTRNRDRPLQRVDEQAAMAQARRSEHAGKTSSAATRP
jgi:hypothetical protein